jgi:hypothetical protein
MAYNFQIIEDCMKCTFRDDHLFCELPDEALKRLQKIKATSVYPKGALLCIEGQPASCVLAAPNSPPHRARARALSCGSLSRERF